MLLSVVAMVVVLVAVMVVWEARKEASAVVASVVARRADLVVAMEASEEASVARKEDSHRSHPRREDSEVEDSEARKEDMAVDLVAERKASGSDTSR